MYGCEMDYKNIRVSLLPDDMQLLKNLQVALKAKFNLTHVSQTSVLRHAMKALEKEIENA